MPKLQRLSVGIEGFCDFTLGFPPWPWNAHHRPKNSSVLGQRVIQLPDSNIPRSSAKGKGNWSLTRDCCSVWNLWYFLRKIEVFKTIAPDHFGVKWFIKIPLFFHCRIYHGLILNHILNCLSNMAEGMIYISISTNTIINYTIVLNFSILVQRFEIAFLRYTTFYTYVRTHIPKYMCVGLWVFFLVTKYINIFH